MEAEAQNDQICGVRAVRSGRRSRATGSSHRTEAPRAGEWPDDYAKPAAANIPAIDANVDSGELIAAQLPQVLVMHDPSGGSQVWSCSRKPPRRDQYLGRGQDAHHDSMSTCNA
jgi:hypothetical protein